MKWRCLLPQRGPTVSTDMSVFERFEVRERESEEEGKKSWCGWAEGGETVGEISIQMNQRNCCGGKIVDGEVSVGREIPKIAKRRRERLEERKEGRRPLECHF